jgi:tetratricopeptide (TPR) repeat protein
MALSMLQDPLAQRLLRECLDECRRLDPVPVALEVRILGHLGADHVCRQEWEQAVAVYQEAVTLAGPLRDISRLARMYGDLSIAHLELGDLDQARSCAERAIALFEMERDERSITRAENNLGLVLLKLGDLAGATRHLEASLVLSRRLDLRSGQAHVLLSLAELERTRGDLEMSKTRAEEALRAAYEAGETLSGASARLELAHALHLMGRDEECDRCMADAIRLLASSGASRRLVEAQAFYAEILEDRGDPGGALAQLKGAIDQAAPRRRRLRAPVASDSNRAEG